MSTMSVLGSDDGMGTEDGDGELLSCSNLLDGYKKAEFGDEQHKDRMLWC